mmetsp:Transcript_24793/g.78034  ORF Transcript_24793/g.78034 Transcript_24793/m.78034 type:complete len:208 (+) Transcript_24793:330-953(+)
MVGLRLSKHKLAETPGTQNQGALCRLPADQHASLAGDLEHLAAGRPREVWRHELLRIGKLGGQDLTLAARTLEVPQDPASPVRKLHPAVKGLLEGQDALTVPPRAADVGLHAGLLPHRDTLLRQHPELPRRESERVLGAVGGTSRLQRQWTRAPHRAWLCGLLQPQPPATLPVTLDGALHCRLGCCTLRRLLLPSLAGGLVFRVQAP